MIADYEFRPQKIDDDTLKIFDDTLIIPLKVIGCSLPADEILKEWDELEKNGYPLICISRLLVAFELIDRERGKFYILPLLIHLIKIIDAIYSIRLIDGGIERTNKLKKELCALVSNATNRPTDQRKIANNQIVNTLISFGDEFQIGCILHKLHMSLTVKSERS
jgi:hypothetical protein